MALFAYKAIDTRGKTMLGQIEAINLVDLELRLKRMGLDLVRGGPTRHGGRPVRPRPHKRAPPLKFLLHLQEGPRAGPARLQPPNDLPRSLPNRRFCPMVV